METSVDRRRDLRIFRDFFFVLNMFGFTFSRTFYFTRIVISGTKRIQCADEPKQLNNIENTGSVQIIRPIWIYLISFLVDVVDFYL